MLPEEREDSSLSPGKKNSTRRALRGKRIVYEVMVEATFEAAHQLPLHEGKCARLHGHNYRVQVFVAGDQLQDSGMLIDFGDVRRECRETIDYFDHRYLNELDEFTDAYPTAEQLARSIHERLSAALSAPGRRVARVRVWETPTSCVTYTPGSDADDG
jgi:6-pyruvoyltetrahydropterin/6-carboxytetrahydropterin synthase